MADPVLLNPMQWEVLAASATKEGYTFGGFTRNTEKLFDLGLVDVVSKTRKGSAVRLLVATDKGRAALKQGQSNA